MPGDNGDSRVDALNKRIVDKNKEINDLEVKYKSILDVVEQTKTQGTKLIGQLEMLQSDLAELAVPTSQPVEVKK